MDEAHVDHLARTIFTGSRRDCLRAFAAALLGLVVAQTDRSAIQVDHAEAESSTKQPATPPLGSPCEVDAQCAIDHADGMESLQDRDSVPICGDNGMAKDGLGNCCKPAGEFAFCRRDADCCGEAICVGIKQLGTICIHTDQRDLGMSCTYTAQCYG